MTVHISELVPMLLTVLRAGLVPSITGSPGI